VFNQEAQATLICSSKKSRLFHL